MSKVRVIVDLPLSALDALCKLATTQGTTMTEAIRRAIGTESMLYQCRLKGYRVLLENNGNFNEIVFYQIGNWPYILRYMAN